MPGMGQEEARGDLEQKGLPDLGVRALMVDGLGEEAGPVVT